MPDLAMPRIAAPSPLLITRDSIPESVAALQQGDGPIVIVVPGTGADALTDTTAAVVNQMNADLPTPVNVGVIKYDSSAANFVERLLHDSKSGDAVLDHTLRTLGAAHTAKPVYLLSESQGSWLVGDALRKDPKALDAVTRALMFSKPDFVKLPPAETPSPTPASDAGPSLLDTTYDSKLQLIDHTDDVIPGLFDKVDLQRIESAEGTIAGAVHGQGIHYVPHHYIADAAAGALYLENGTRPLNPIHSSHIHDNPPAPAPIPAIRLAP